MSLVFRSPGYFFCTFLGLLGSHVTKILHFQAMDPMMDPWEEDVFVYQIYPNKIKPFMWVNNNIYIYTVPVPWILVIWVIIWGRLGQPKEDVSHDSWGPLHLPHPTPHGSTKVQCRCTRDAPPFQTTGGVPGGVE